MNFKQLCTDLSKEMDAEKAESMSRLMNGEFTFKGLDTGARARVMKAQLDAAKDDTDIDWEFIDCCWEQNIREFQYFALNYLMKMHHLLKIDDIARLKQLIVEKPGWDTNNILYKLINIHTAYYPELEQTVVAWSKEGNPWLQRTALLFQMNRAQYTNTELLEEVLLNSLDSDNAYVQNAIVRALKDADKHHPDFVKQFLEKYHKDSWPENNNTLN